MLIRRMGEKGYSRYIVTVGILAGCYLLNLSNPAFAAEEKKPDRRARAPNFSVVMGTISKIDTTDPANPKLVVKNDEDNTIHTIEMSPWTNVSKVTDISELKSGDAVRIMARKAEDKEIAITVLFGKIKNIPGARPLRQTKPAAQMPTAPIRQGEIKK